MNRDTSLDRIGYRGSLAPNAVSLRQLHPAHLLTVPFENLHIHYGEPIVRDNEALFDKVVGHPVEKPQKLGISALTNRTVPIFHARLLTLPINPVPFPALGSLSSGCWHGLQSQALSYAQGIVMVRHRKPLQ